MVSKKLINLRILSWGIGCACFVMSWEMNHDNTFLWNMAFQYNRIVILSSLVPVAMIALITESLHHKRSILGCIGKIVGLLILFVLYVTFILSFSGMM